jgi:vacuolar iron transporter family protein
MAAGEYVSVRSQRELLEAASQELDGPTLRALAELEAEELRLVFRARGMAADQAEGRAAALVAGATTNRRAAATPAPRRPARTWSGRRWERPGSASCRSLPELPSRSCRSWSPRGRPRSRSPLSWSGWRCSPPGATVGLLTGGSLLRRGLRQLGIGAAAALVTYGLGRLFGTTIG